MRIVIDLDLTICDSKREGESYEDVRPLPGAVKTIQNLKKSGHTIIISTARHMKTCNNNIGEITVKQSRLILNWCDKWGIPCDELYLGKPLGDVYIDDKAIQFKSWKQIKNRLSKM